MSFTPTLKGHYSVDVTFNGVSISTDMSATWAQDGRSQGLMVESAAVSGPQSVHTAKPIAIQGVLESFSIQAKDQFSNQLDTSVTTLASGSHFDARLTGPTLNEAQVTEVQTNTNGMYTVTYMPDIAGQYQLDVTLRTSGGLVATIFREPDFSLPLTGDDLGTDHCSHISSDVLDGPDPFHPTGSEVTCTTSRIDSSLSFDWGTTSPADEYELTLQGGANFELEHFSMRWQGFIRAPASGDVTFTIRASDSTVLTIDGVKIAQVSNDAMDSGTFDTIVSGVVSDMTQGQLYPIVLEYAYDGTTFGAFVELTWSYGGDASSTPIPSSELFYVSNLEGSPMTVDVYPGAITTTSSADGEGTQSGVAMQESTFVITARDQDGNVMTAGTSETSQGQSQFEVTLIGHTFDGKIDDWAAIGRTDEVTDHGNPIEISGITIEPLDWTLVCNSCANATHGSRHIVSSEHLQLSGVQRGDKLKIGNEIVIVDLDVETLFTASQVPISSPFLGVGVSSTSVWKVGDSTGQYLVRYTPLVRGTYNLDVKLPSILELQQINISTTDDSTTLGGAFQLSYGDKSVMVAFDAHASDLETSIRNDLQVDVNVSLHDLDSNTGARIWYVEFQVPGDVASMEVNGALLTGNAVTVTTSEIVRGRENAHIVNSQSEVMIESAHTDLTRTVAFGPGLVFGMYSLSIYLIYLFLSDTHTIRYGRQDFDIYDPSKGRTRKRSQDRR